MKVMQLMRRPPRRDHHFPPPLPPTRSHVCPREGHPRGHQIALRFLGILRPTMHFDKKLRPIETVMPVEKGCGPVLRPSLDKSTKVIAEYRQDAA